MICNCGGETKPRVWIQRGKTRWDGTVTEAEECKSCGRVCKRFFYSAREYAKGRGISYPIFARGNHPTELTAEMF